MHMQEYWCNKDHQSSIGREYVTNPAHFFTEKYEVKKNILQQKCDWLSGTSVTRPFFSIHVYFGLELDTA